MNKTTYQKKKKKKKKKIENKETMHKFHRKLEIHIYLKG